MRSAKKKKINDASSTKIQNSSLISLKDVSNNLWDKKILKNVSWSTKFGQNWAIMGPNGAGKSVLIKIILGQLPYFGTIIRHEKISNFEKIVEVTFDQQKLLSVKEEKKDRYEEFSGHEQRLLTGREFIDPSKKNSEKLQKTAEEFCFSTILDKPIRYFSNGEVRKSLIVKALLANPKLIILDEPFDGLDTLSVKWLKETISAIINKGLTVWLVSHQFDELVPEIEHVLCLKSGEVFAKGLRSEIITTTTMQKLYGISNLDNFNKREEIINDVKYNGISQQDLTDSTPKKNKFTHIIKMENVNINYGRKVVLKQFNWSVKTGENWKIIGPNGAGKSTLLSLISGDNLQAYSNKIYLFGKKRGSGESIWDIKKKIGLVSPESQLLYREPISVLKVVLSGFFDSVGLYTPTSKNQKKIASKWLQFLEIENLSEHTFTRLSYGQQRLILIARALVKSPQLLILDEPCQGLDLKNREHIIKVIDKIGQNSATQIIYVTHVVSDQLNCFNYELIFESCKEGSFKTIIKLKKLPS